MSSRLLHELADSIDRLPDGAIVVAFSGGMDSTVLLHALASLPAARTRGLRAIHVDHGLQPASARWAEHCAQFAAKLEIACTDLMVAPDVASGNGIEAAARNARYDAIADHLDDGAILAVAQHADDQAETILLKLLRGAGPEGLGGMRALRAFASGYLWRPLLGTRRAHLHDYATANGLHWIEDPSNTDTSLRRNFLRREILPRLSERWPDATLAMAHSATWARDAADFIGAQARIALARIQGADPSTLAWREWLDLPAALRDPALRAWLRELDLDEPTHFQLTELERQLAHAAQDRSPCVRWGNCELHRYRDRLHAMRPLTPIPANWARSWDGPSLTLPDGSCLLWRSHRGDLATGQIRRFEVSYRRGGEHFKPVGAANTRELRQLLQESGVPPWQRERIPLIHADDELVAVGDLFVSARGRELCEQMQARIVWERDATPESIGIDSSAPLR